MDRSPSRLVRLHCRRMPESSPPSTIICPGCRNPVPARIVVCPSCHSLLHRELLEKLSTGADAALRSNAPLEAIRLWREMLPLVPASSLQYRAIAQKIEAAIREAQSMGNELRKGPPRNSRWAEILGPLGRFRV